MEDFTGGVKEIVVFSQESKDIFSLIHKSMLRSSLISCSISTGDTSGETKLDNGLIAGHAYTVTDAKRVEIPNHGVLEMVRVRNPWGNEREWKGAWSDDSPEWKSIPEEVCPVHRVISRFIAYVSTLYCIIQICFFSKEVNWN